MRGDDRRPEPMFSYVSAEERIPLDHPFGMGQNLVRAGRHLLRSVHDRLLRTRAFLEWDDVTWEQCSNQTSTLPSILRARDESFSRKASIGAASVALGTGYPTRPVGAAMLNSAAVTAADDLANLQLHEAATLVRQKKVSPVQLTQACIASIAALTPRLNAFITVTAESALAQARQAEAELQRGMWRGPLHGIPIALKDLVDTAGVRTTGGSALFKDRVPREDAAVVQRLRDGGAVFLGKLNMYEVAFGPTTKETSFFGRVANPWAIEHISGGSSSGSGAAVAAGLCFAALGSDTGGSIRQPAAFCGVVGLMPSYRRVSPRGAIPLSWSADYLGPMTRTVVDAALMLRAIAGDDPHGLSCRTVARPSQNVDSQSDSHSVGRGRTV